MKRIKSKGKSARRGNSPSSYSKFNKRPYDYQGESRLAGGDLKVKANDKINNKYK